MKKYKRALLKNLSLLDSNIIDSFRPYGPLKKGGPLQTFHSDTDDEYENDIGKDGTKPSKVRSHYHRDQFSIPWDELDDQASKP